MPAAASGIVMARNGTWYLPICQSAVIKVATATVPINTQEEISSTANLSPRRQMPMAPTTAEGNTNGTTGQGLKKEEELAPPSDDRPQFPCGRQFRKVSAEPVEGGSRRFFVTTPDSFEIDLQQLIAEGRR